VIGVDYEFREQVEVADAVELEQVFHDRKEENFRIVGTGTEQGRLPAPPAEAVLLSLRRLNSIERLETEDLTCSVQPGVLRAELDAELESRDLCLPCAGGGTIGGLFAADPIGSLAPSGHSPRSLLLGLEGILPEGLCFRSGARVVKSVAGFDLQKLFAGSRGRLFAATLLHLKLRPKPRARASFSSDAMEREAAVSLFSRLRRRSASPTSLVLIGDRGSFSVHGVFEGTAALVNDGLKQSGLRQTEADLPLRIEAGEGMEVLRGRLRPSRLLDLLAVFRKEVDVLVTGGGWFEVALQAAETYQTMDRLSTVEVSAEITGAGPARRGRGTAIDAKAASLMQSLKMALDPKGVLV
jgi:glycolate oxidase FAD binding subunit